MPGTAARSWVTAKRALWFGAALVVLTGLLYYYCGPLVVGRLYAARIGRGDAVGADRLSDMESPPAQRSEGGMAGMNEFLASNGYRIDFRSVQITFLRNERVQYLPNSWGGGYMPVYVSGPGMSQEPLILAVSLEARGWRVWGLMTAEGNFLRLENGALRGLD